MDLNQLGTSDTGRQFWFRCLCNRHKRKLTVQAVEKRRKALACKVCSCGDRGSSYEVKAYEELAAMGFNDTVTECKVLMEKYGAVDVYLPAYNLLIQIDGEQHYKGRAFTEEAQHQVLRDRRFLFAALSKGFNVIRVAYKDICSLGMLVKLMLSRVAQSRAALGLLSLHSRAVMGVATDGAGFVQGKRMGDLPSMFRRLACWWCR